MNGTIKAAVVSICGWAAFVACPARAATVLSLEVASGDGPAKPMTVIIDGERMSLSTSTTDFIFFGAQHKAVVLNKSNRWYFELTPAAIGQASKHMTQMMARMQQQLASAPEAQRKQIEAMMASRGVGGPAGAAAAPAPSYESAGSARTVGNWSCAPWRVIARGQAQAEICLAKIDDLGLTRDDLRPFIDFNAFIGKLSGAYGGLRPPTPPFDFDRVSKAVGFDAFAVQTTRSPTGAGKGVIVTLKSVEKKDAPADAFEISAGYAKREMGKTGKP